MRGGRGEREVVNEDAMDRGVCEMRQIYGDIAGRKDERQWSNSYPIHGREIADRVQEE